jgi:hypothetical protein
MQPGDSMMIPCRGGPTGWRTAVFPPPLEVPLGDGFLVLVDEGPPEHWTYEFIASRFDA